MLNLTGGQANSSSKPYCDGVAGDSVTSKIRPLTTQEAMILTNFNSNYSNAVTTASNYWCLASPGDPSNPAVRAAEVYADGSGHRDGFYVYVSSGLRPALMLNLIYE